MKLAETTKAKIAQQVQTLHTEIIDARWVQQTNYHLTLVFLGSQEWRAIKELSVQVNALAGTLYSFNYVLNGWGCFPDSGHARVLYAGVGKAANTISSLARQLSCLVPGSEFPRRFHPHLTVARFRQPVKVILPEQFEPIQESAQEITLFSSKLTPSGPVYTALDKFYFACIATGE